MVGADETTELWQPPNAIFFKIAINKVREDRGNGQTVSVLASKYVDLSLHPVGVYLFIVVCKERKYTKERQPISQWRAYKCKMP